jgi:hypothetical protein
VKIHTLGYKLEDGMPVGLELIANSYEQVLFVGALSLEKEVHYKTDIKLSKYYDKPLFTIIKICICCIY